MNYFSSKCNICYEKKSNLKNIRRNKALLKQFNTMLRNCFLQNYYEEDIPIYLCDNCCEKIISFNQLRNLFFNSLTNMREMYLRMKTVLQRGYESIAEMKPVVLNHKMRKCSRSCVPVHKKRNNGTDPASTTAVPTVSKTSDAHQTLAIQNEECYSLVSESSSLSSSGSPVPKQPEQTESKGKDIEQERCNYKRPDKRHACSECDKAYRHRHSLIRHQRIHTGDKPFVCESCGRAFTERSHLLRHRFIHLRVRPYSCSDCDKTFIQRSDLVRHLRIHSGVKPYSCAECGRAFADQSDVRKHSKRAHRTKNQ